MDLTRNSKSSFVLEEISRLKASISMKLILKVLLEVKSKQQDITAAFLYANLKEGRNVFVDMPLDF